MIALPSAKQDLSSTDHRLAAQGLGDHWLRGQRLKVSPPLDGRVNVVNASVAAAAGETAEFRP